MFAYQLMVGDIVDSHDDERHLIVAVSDHENRADGRNLKLTVQKGNGETYNCRFKPMDNVRLADEQ